ncbi:MAG: glycosyltransferase family 2 protein [Polyangiaceae bacterium]|nr:glycosyltransferase family 2 protein [Polyangiaceae bacterium]
MSALPFVTIAMPCLNEEAYIEACVRTVAAQDYPKDRMEILIADGGSTDRTREILKTLAEEDPRIFVIDNPDKIQAAGMNEIIRQSKGKMIVRMDVHCEYASDYLSQCIAALERSGADNAGGAQRAKARSLFQKALCAALESPLGVGGAAYRSPENEGYVDTVFLGAFRRRVFETVGMYDPKAITNEDAELNQRILDAGGKVFLSKDVVVHYFPRDSFYKLAQQYYKYGRGRARTLLKLGKFLSVRPALPFLMVVSGAGLLLTSPFQPITPFAFGAYALATGVEAVRVGRKAGLSAIPVVWGIFPTLHVSHGIGFAAGLIKYGLNPDWSEPEILTPQTLVTYTGEPAEA